MRERAELIAEHVLDVIERVRGEHVGEPQVRLASRSNAMKGVARDEHRNTLAKSSLRPGNRDEPGARQNEIRLSLLVPVHAKRAAPSGCLEARGAACGRHRAPAAP